MTEFKTGYYLLSLTLKKPMRIFIQKLDGEYQYWTLASGWNPLPTEWYDKLEYNGII